MIRTLTAATIAAMTLSTAAQAGPVERACLRSDRAGAAGAVCACIQQVADMTLTGSDQRRAASFFKDPEKAQDVFLSQSASDDAFWDRYQNFGRTAEAYCGG